MMELHTSDSALIPWLHRQ